MLIGPATGQTFLCVGLSEALAAMTQPGLPPTSPTGRDFHRWAWQLACLPQLDCVVGVPKTRSPGGGLIPGRNAPAEASGMALPGFHPTMDSSAGNSAKRRSSRCEHPSVKLLCAQFERFERWQWLRDCSGLVMPPAPSEAGGGRNEGGTDDKDAHD